MYFELLFFSWVWLTEIRSFPRYFSTKIWRRSEIPTFFLKRSDTLHEDGYLKTKLRYYYWSWMQRTAPRPSYAHRTHRESDRTHIWGLSHVAYARPAPNSGRERSFQSRDSLSSSCTSPGRAGAGGRGRGKITKKFQTKLIQTSQNVFQNLFHSN